MKVMSKLGLVMVATLVSTAAAAQPPASPSAARHVDPVNGLSLDQALAFERRHGDRFQVRYQPGLAYEHLDVMLDNPFLADVRVRQALLYGQASLAIG